jgi:hypothetical protein
LAQALICFFVQLDDSLNPYDLVTGMAHLFGGAAVYLLWQAVPVNMPPPASSGSDPNAGFV